MATKHYSDEKVQFTFPASFRLVPPDGDGPYMLHRKRNTSLIMFILPKALMRGMFAQLAMGPSPDPERRVKTVYDSCTVAGKSGRAITCDVLGRDGKLLSHTLQFFFETSLWSVMVELMTEPPADQKELEEILATVEVAAD